MLEEIKKEFTLFRLLVFLLTIAVSIYLLQILWQFLANFSDIIVIVVIAWLLSFVLEPLVDIVTKFARMPKIASALLVYVLLSLIFAAMILVFIPVVTSEFQTLSGVIPQYLDPYPKFAETWNNAITHSIDTFIIFLPSVATIAIDIFLILVLSFYFVVDKDRINEELYKLAPKNWHSNLKFIQKTVDETFASFLQIQVIFGIIAGITTWIVLRIFSVDFAASIALLAGLITIIPLIGPIIGVIPPAFIAFATNPNNPLEAVLIAAILLLLQQLSFNAFGPKLMGKAFRLHPIIVFLSIIIGFKVAGAFGAVFIVPFLGILVIVIKKLGYHFINPEAA